MNDKKKYDSKELLRPGNMLRLYASGAFPMAEENGINVWNAIKIANKMVDKRIVFK